MIILLHRDFSLYFVLWEKCEVIYTIKLRIRILLSGAAELMSAQADLEYEEWIRYKIVEAESENKGNKKQILHDR